MKAREARGAETKAAGGSAGAGKGAGNRGIPQKSGDTASRTIDKKALIIRMENHRAYTLNASGTIVWGKINGRNSEREIIEKAAAEFDAKRSAVERDVRDFLRELKKEGLVAMK